MKNSKIAIILGSMIFSASAMADMTGTASFDLSVDADSYTLYQVSDAGDIEVIAASESPPLSFTIDDADHATFYVTASNAQGESEPSELVYWYKPGGPIQVQLRPGPPVLTININVNTQ